MTTCTYKFTDETGREVTITGLSEMKAYLVSGGLEFLLPAKKLPWTEAEAATGPAPVVDLITAKPAPTMEGEGNGNDTKPDQTGVGSGAQGAEPGALQQPEASRDAGRDAAPAGGQSGAVDRGNAPAGDRGGNDRGESRVRGESAGADTDAQQPVSSSRGSGAEAGRRGAGQPASSVANYRIQPGELKREGSWRATAERNVQIVELVKKITAEERQATPEERALLAKFTGWGASEIANGIFPDRYGRYKDATWQDLGERLKSALTEEEYAQARRTTQYAHYTSEGVIRSIYSGLQRLGFAGGTLVEPGMGPGHFNGLMPDGIAANSHYTGIEYDTLTGMIAKLLYPQSNVIIGDYTRTSLPKDFFDAAIGNPPFSQTQVLSDPEYKSKRPMLHDYFFMKTIDRVKPGGVLVFVTSKGTMDKGSDKSRKYLADRANLLGAVRLPQTAFKDNAGTEVVTDVIFLQKRGPGIADNGVKWLGTKEVQTKDGPAAINEYFADHPEMVLGTHALQGSMYRANEYTVLPPEGDIEQLFARAVENLPENVFRPTRGSQAERAQVQDRDFNPKHKKEGGLYLSDDGKLMQVENGSGVEVTHRTNAEGKPIALTQKQKQWLKGYVGLRDALKQAQYDQLNDGDWQKSLKALNKAYDSFVKEHGQVLEYTTIERTDKDGNTTETKRYKNEPLLRMDAEGALAYSLEQVKEDGTIIKGAVLNERVLERPRDPEIKTTQDALFVSLNRHGSLVLDDVAALAGTDKETVIRDLGTSIYDAPGAGWQLADEYLSGNVVRKLKEAKAAAEIDPRYKRNVEALLAAQPRPLGPTDITVRLGANWVPASDIKAFAEEVLGDTFRISYSPILNRWDVDQLSRNVTEWGFDKATPGMILDAVLNNRQIKITYTDSQKKTHVDLEATEKANDIASKMRDRFRSWIWQEPKRSERLVNYYNDHFNNIAPRKFDGSHLTLPGISSRYKLYPHQKRAVWRIIQQGDTYLAHAVGAGKTMEMIAGGMEERRLGLTKKPMYVVPNHMLAQFSREFLELYPTANIMVADEHNFHTHNRKRFVAQAALNNPDAIIITHSAFGRIGMSDEFYADFISRQIDAWKEALDEAEGDRITTKQIERRIESLEQRLEGRQSRDKKDQVLNFEELGVDKLFVDEFHEFRKLDFATNQSNVKGIDPNGSQRALDLSMKVEYLRGKKPGRALVAASGTPVTNTMGELFTAQRFFQPTQLKEDGLENFDAWASQYGDIVTGFEQNAAGGYEMVARFARFQNVPELMRRVRSFMDILTSSNLGELVKRPDVVGGGRSVEVTPVPEGYKEYQQELQTRIQAIRKRKGPPEKGQDIILNVIGDGRFSAIDMRFVDPSRPSDPNSKLNIAIDNIISAYRETADWEYSGKDGKPDPIKGASVILFTDIGLGEQSAATRGFDMRAWIEKRLVEAGIPRDHIAFMRDFKQHSKKERLFADMREGKKRILIGGKEMETGTNVQKRLAYLFHLDAPWFPASVEQREGRIVRQGNQNKEVRVKAFATKGSYDSTMWGMNARKARFIEQAMNGDDSVRSLEDVSEASAFEMAAALASGDERYLKLAGLKADVEKMERLRSAHYDDQNRLARDKHYAEESIKRNTARVKELDKAIAKRTPIKAGEFLAKVGNKDYDSREDFSQAIFREFKKLAEAESMKVKTVGEIGGFDIKFYGAEMKGSGAYAAALHVDLPGDPDSLIEFPLSDDFAINGIATRAANQVNGLDRDRLNAQGIIDSSKAKIEQIDKRLGAAFPEESILLEKVSELASLEAELASENKENNADAAAATAQVEGATANDEAAASDEPRYSVGEDGKPVAEFGPVTEEYRDDPAGAIKYLEQQKDGEAIINHPLLGEISLVYGDKTKGLAHIVARRGDDFTSKIADILQNGTLYSKINQRGRVFLGTDINEAAVRLDWNGQAKTWLVSAYEKYPDLSKIATADKAKRSEVVSQRSRGMSVHTLRSEITRGLLGGIVNTMIDKGIIVLHQNSRSLPDNLGKKVKGIRGVVNVDGKIHLVASNIELGGGRGVQFHEVLHAFVRQSIGDKNWQELKGRGASIFRQAGQTTGKLNDVKRRALERLAAAKKAGAVSQRNEVEEFLAYSIEEYERAPESLPAILKKWVEDFIGFIKAALVKKWGIWLGEVTPAQLSALAKFALMDVAAMNRRLLFGPAGEWFSVGDSAKQTETPAFKAWFGDSKVVDAEGKPLVVYHGTYVAEAFDNVPELTRDKGNITSFDRLYTTRFRQHSIDTVGSWFSSNPGDGGALMYAGGGRQPGGAIYPVYLSIKNPHETTFSMMLRRARLLANGKDDGRMVGKEEVDAYRKWLKTMDKDGIKLVHDEGAENGSTEFKNQEVFIALEPEQIKSAIGNNGDFDPTNPDIRYSVAPEEADKVLAEADAALDEEPKAKDDYIGRVTSDISLGARLLVHPRTVAAVHPEFTPVYRTAISQMETRDKNIADFGADVQPYDHLDQTGKENVNKVLELGRLTSTVYSDDELTNGVTNTGEKKVVAIVDGKPKVTSVPVTAMLTAPGEIIQLSKEERAAYRNLRSMFDRALDRLRNQTLTEMGFAGFAPMEGMKPLMIEDAGDGKIVLKGSVYTDDEKSVFRSGDKEKIAEVMKNNPVAAIIKKFEGAKFNPELMGYEFDARQRPALEKEMGEFLKKSAAAQIMELIDDTTPPAKAERLQNIANFVAEIEQAKRSGYVPFARYGDYVVTVKEKVADPTFIEDSGGKYIVQGLPDSFAADMLELGATKAPESEGGGWLIDKAQKQAVEKLTEQTVYSAKVETGLTDLLGERKAQRVDDIPAVKEAIEKARKEWVGDNPARRIVAFKVKEKKSDTQVKLSDVDALAEVASIDNATWDAIRDKLADAIKSKGFRRHFFHSDNVPGYTGDFERSIADYVIGMSGYLSRRQHMKQWENSVTAITDKPKLYTYATKYRDYVNNPQEELAMVRQIGFFSYIAGVLASAFANLTQVPIMAAPTLAQVAPVHAVTYELTRAYKDATRMLSTGVGLDMFDPNKAPEDVRGILKEAWAEGSFVPLESFDMMMTARQRNTGARKGVKAFNTMTQVTSVAFTFAERMNRLVTFIAAARLAEKRAIQENAKKALAGDALARAEVLRNWSPKSFAEWVVDESQYRMGKANRPTTMRGVGSAIMQFKGFMLQTFEAWYRMASLHGKGGKFAAAASIATLYAFAGIWGLPGADDLRKLLEDIYKQITDKDLDLKTELRAWIARTSGSNALAQIVTKGATYPLGVDLTRVGMGSVAPNSPLAAAGIPFDMLIGRPKRAFEKASSGDNLGAAAELSPNFIKHWLVSGSWAINGVRDKQGNRILLPKDLSSTDLAMKAVGFQPSIVTDVRDYEYAERRMETAVDALKRGYINKLARAFVELENETDPKKAKAIDDRITEIYADIEEHNATASPEQIIKIDNRALRNKIMREFDGVKGTWGKERKQARGAAEELRGVFGLSQSQDDE